MGDGRTRDAAILARDSLRNLAAAGDPLLTLARLGSVARIMSLMGRPYIGAQLIAHAEKRHDEIGAREIWVGDAVKETLSIVHQAIDEAAFEEAWDQGHNLSPEAAMALAATELEDAIERNRGS